MHVASCGHLQTTSVNICVLHGAKVYDALICVELTTIHILLFATFFLILLSPPWQIIWQCIRHSTLLEKMAQLNMPDNVSPSSSLVSILTALCILCSNVNVSVRHNKHPVVWVRQFSRDRDREAEAELTRSRRGEARRGETRWGSWESGQGEASQRQRQVAWGRGEAIRNQCQWWYALIIYTEYTT